MINRRDVLAQSVFLPVSGSASSQPATTAALSEPNSRPSEITPQMFGAAGESAVDSTAALDRLAAYLNADGKTAIAVRFPPGVYHYRGAGLSLNVQHVCLAAEPGTVTIVAASTVDFLTLNGLVASTSIRGLNFSGGAKVITYSSSQANVTGFHVFADLEFRDYTRSAISNNAIDHPYLKVMRCLFRASYSAQAIGIAFGGYLDGMTLEGCTFQRNTIHVKIGPRLSGSIHLRDCDFLNFSGGERVADVWIAPNVTDGGNNAGGGLVVSECKFGNEGQRSDQTRVLVAVESGNAAARADLYPELRWVGDGAYMSGLTIKDCRIASVGLCTAPFITSYIGHFDRFLFADNVCENSYPALCNFQIPTGAKQVEQLRWVVRMLAPPFGRRSFARLTNTDKVVHLDDPWGAVGA